MSKAQIFKPKTNQVIAVVICLFACIAIAFLSYKVAREIRLLGSASSDNIQWSLAQTEVEFLEFQNQVESDQVDLGQLRQKFDVFYSRINTIKVASVFAELREDETSRAQLDAVSMFLDDAVSIIDGEDAVLISSIPERGGPSFSTSMQPC